MNDKNSKPGRRNFLIGAGVAGAAGAAAVASQGLAGGEPVRSAKPDTKGKGGGYHVTDHVRSYYRTTLV